MALGILRALPGPQRLELLGGGAAVPRFAGARAAADALGLGARATALITSADGVRTVDALLAASSLEARRALDALAVAKMAGLLTLTAAPAPAAPLPAFGLLRLTRSSSRRSTPTTSRCSG